jgi:bacterioferritin
MIGENVPEALACDLKLEREAHPVLKKAIAHCESVGDYVTRELFERILEGEEDHIDWLETQLDLIKEVGLQNYLQAQMS